ncbi:hypothetical protein ACIREM_30635 [Streptomyces shenzhenensis]|uniref:hypothetical protein n=1 Tax=Streptomyces shenzhenensis TaxID=943815 RepID=UPI0037FD3274
MLVHHGRKRERKGFREKDFAVLPDAVHQRVDELAALARTRLKRMHYQPGLPDGFIAETGLIPALP